jgi:hypothetical protein
VVVTLPNQHYRSFGHQHAKRHPFGRPNSVISKFRIFVGQRREPVKFTDLAVQSLVADHGRTLTTGSRAFFFVREAG